MVDHAPTTWKYTSIEHTDTAAGDVANPNSTVAIPEAGTTHRKVKRQVDGQNDSTIGLGDEQSGEATELSGGGVLLNSRFPSEPRAFRSCYAREIESRRPCYNATPSMVCVTLTQHGSSVSRYPAW